MQCSAMRNPSFVEKMFEKCFFLADFCLNGDQPMFPVVRARRLALFRSLILMRKAGQQRREDIQQSRTNVKVGSRLASARPSGGVLSAL